MTFRVLSCDICTLPTCSDLFSMKRSGSPPEVEYQRLIVTQLYRARRVRQTIACLTLRARLSVKTVAQKEMRIKLEVLIRFERLKRRRRSLCRAALSFGAAG